MDAGRKLLVSHGGGLESEAAQMRLDGAARDQAAHLASHPRSGRSRRAGRREQAVPSLDLESGETGLVQRGYPLQPIAPPHAGDGQRLEVVVWKIGER